MPFELNNSIDVTKVVNKIHSINVSAFGSIKLMVSHTIGQFGLIKVRLSSLNVIIITYSSLAATIMHVQCKIL